MEQGRNDTRVEESFRLQLQQLENIHRELGSRGEVGDDPGWIQEYVYRLLEVSEALRGIALSHRGSAPER